MDLALDRIEPQQFSERERIDRVCRMELFALLMHHVQEQEVDIRRLLLILQLEGIGIDLLRRHIHDSANKC